ncbi:MAG: TAT-variant-translocated molybdopterin oxidoreductase [Cytophagaceae bacterium]|nr:TAT-variant-translocated molybdopterin oxidoreductase [Cytophagaceae bacterium]
MKDTTKKYWKGLEELNNEPEFLKQAQNEFPDYLPIKESSGKDTSESSGTDRRDFLKLLGFGVAAASLAACEAPVKKVIPYVNKPEEIDPGNAVWYASTYMDGGEYCSVLVKTREGRPIKIEGNRLSKVTWGGTSARAQASVLSLYDSARLTSFYAGKSAKSKAEADKEIIAKLNNLNGGAIRIVSSTIMSPTTKKAIAEFAAKYSNTEHIQYDANSVSGLIKANKASFGKAVVPSYDFSKAKVIVSFGADFLGTWISPVEYAAQYAKNKKLGESIKKNSTDNEFLLARHYQVETNLSLTGCNADFRLPIKPSEEGLYVAALYNEIVGGLSVNAPKSEILSKAAEDLKNSKGKSLVVSGSNDVNVQILVNEINKALGNIGTTIDLETPSYQRQGDDERMAGFIEDVKAGKVAAVIFYNANPVYDHPMGKELGEALSKVSLSISFSDRMDETSSKCAYVCPDFHYLEAWNDAEPKKGYYSLVQPTISPLFKDTRSAQESLLVWTGNNTDYYTYLTNNWKQNILNGGDWNQALHDGVYQSSGSTQVAIVSETAATETAVSTDLNSIASAIASAKSSGLELKVYEKIGLGSGSQANNPWLQELPDPISKATWGNYVAVSVSYAKDKGLKSGDVVSVTVDGKEAFKLPVLVQPGQAKDTVSIAIGYGRTNAGKAGDKIGQNVYPLLAYSNGTLKYNRGGVDLKPTGDFEEIAQTQTHQTIMGRAIIQDATLPEYITDSAAGRFYPKVTTADGKKVAPKDVTVWWEHEKPNHLWTMVIDLNSCIGCGSCTISCQAENNIPVVGKKEVINRREMHWLRIDRYYSTAETWSTKKEHGKDKYFKGDATAWEYPEENPEVTFQPMLCQQCNHAPCETVCPVAATTHSSEGLNQMAYNRCIGTRYCANNCPYKVRRFNWFKYFDNDKFFMNTSMNTQLGRMVLNPDVTVRSRGVMEKCTFCVQRIQEGKLTAKKENRRPVDGEILTACASACPTNAIMFGDINDASSQVWNQLSEENKKRAYTVLEEVNTRPNIAYLTRIRNKQA